MTTVKHSERELALEKALYFAMLKRTFEVVITKLSERKADESYQDSTVLVLARSQRLQQIVLLLLRDGTQRILHLIDHKGGEPNSLASEGLRVRKDSADFLSWHSVLKMISGTSLRLLLNSTTTK